LYAYWVTVNFREAYGLYACIGILFNHESERRGETFVSRKITRAVGRIKAGTQDALFLGNLAARRDWGYAPEYVEGMWRMLQQDAPEDFVLATGEAHTVEEFAALAFAHAGMPLAFRGEGRERAGVDERGVVRVRVDPTYYRPSEVDLLIGDASRARAELDWSPRVGFAELVRIMVDHDVALAAREGAAKERLRN
jgi:GDPmannose 4,6-dehydratase